MANVVQRSFAGGEIAPALQARTDLVKYATGARTVRNFLIQRQGGLANRAGTELVDEVKDSDHKVRLVRFQFNSDQTYVMEFGGGYIRWYRDAGQLTIDDEPDDWATATDYEVGDLVVNDDVYYYCTSAHTSASTTEPGTGDDWTGSWYALEDDIYEIPTPYLEDDLPLLQFSQSADIVTITHDDYPQHELKRFDHTRWTLEAIEHAPEIGKVGTIDSSGGDTDTSDAVYAVTAIDEETGEESLPTEETVALKKPTSEKPIELTWDALPRAVEYRVYRSDDGLAFGFIGIAGGLSSVRSETTWNTETTQVTTTTHDTEVAGSGEISCDAVEADETKASDGKYKVTGTFKVTASLLDGTVYVRLRAYYIRDAESPRVFAGDIYQTSVPGGAGSGNVPWSGTVTVPDNGYTTLTIEVVPVIRIVGAGEAGATLSITGTKIEATTVGTGFVDDGIEPDYSSAPPKDRKLFQAGESYPAAVGSYQQRRLYGASTAQPERVWASKVGLPKNFNRSTPIGDDDPVIFTLAGQRVNIIRHFVDMDGLFVLTSERVWRIAGNDAGSLTPSAINARQLPFPGAAAELQPLEVGTSAMYVEARGSIIRSLAGDVVQGIQGSDVTIFAAHLFEGHTIVSWDYARIPHSILWAVRDDGVLLGLTYLKEQEVWGWHRHDTDGSFESVCVVSEDDEDVLYAVVKRTIDGSTKRYIERMASRRVSDIRDAIFMDSALSFDGRNTGATTMTLSGGTDWKYTETLTLTASASSFVSGDVGNEIHLEGADGKTVRFVIDAYTSATVVTGHAQKTVPTSLRSTATKKWAKAVDTFTGLDHLEGKDVAVLGDGFVVASPNNSSYTTVTVEDGSITLDRPYAVVHVGLPYISDLETLDIDTPQGPSVKPQRMAVSRVGITVESSRGVWVGREAPSGDDPLEGLEELPTRDALATGGDDYDAPPELQTGYVETNIQADWNRNGRVLVRQVDPLPLTVLAITPQGYIPLGG